MTTITLRSRYYFHTDRDGRRRVFEDLGDIMPGAYLAYQVLDRPPEDPDSRFTDNCWPKDLETAGIPISEEEMQLLTGYVPPADLGLLD